ncbi:hypothetical protein [Lacticaseibacillus kribbianus]|uniref:hypothetical protein n=1 Tax=Lacticaseibacillus kribbianus TaxID=2926292 RepID=UPI001CD6EA79|nr:hypothetical protein [Lacticaseibacillus kribbianus]
MTQRQTSHRALRWLALGLALILGVTLGGLHEATAATAPQLVIQKRVSVDAAGTTQRTAPLAGARYRVLRIVAAGDAPIAPTDAASYRPATGLAAFDRTLVTDARGRAAAALTPGASYLVQELASAAIPRPASPVAITAPRGGDTVTVTPKSGLVTTTSVPPRLPLTGIDPKTVTAAGTPVGSIIAHTGGTLRLQSPLPLLAGLLLAAGGYLLAIRRLARTRRRL